jgi:hypothetical protein
MKIISDIARSVGTCLAYRTCYESYSYDGKTIAIYEDRDSKFLRSYSNILHDVAHFAVSNKNRRQLPEFGLGSSPDNNTIQVDRIASISIARSEEIVASALGIYWEREIGCDWYKTYLTHHWPVCDKDKVFSSENRIFLKSIRKLEKKGLITL